MPDPLAQTLGQDEAAVAEAQQQLDQIARCNTGTVERR
jgi:hypothetical protein